MNILIFLISKSIEIYTMILLLYIWMQWVRCDFYHPFFQFLVKVTKPIIGPLHRFIPTIGPIDNASLLIAFILSIIKAILMSMVITLQPTIWIIAVLILFKDINSLILLLLLIIAILNWVSHERSSIEYIFIQLTEPILKFIRLFLPRKGNIDFSPIILILFLYTFNIGIDGLLNLMNKFLI